MKLRDVVALALRQLGAKEEEIEKCQRESDAALDPTIGDTEVAESDIPRFIAQVHEQHAHSIKLAKEHGAVAAIAFELQTQRQIEANFRRRARKN